MDGTIKVSTQELRSASSQFSSYGSEIQNLTSQMLSLISGITGAVWSGEAASAYQSKFAGLEADISKINKMILALRYLCLQNFDILRPICSNNYKMQD